MRAWHDPGLDRAGHAVHSRYVERCWLGVLGPSATWLLRRLDDVLAAAPSNDPTGGVPVDLVALAQQMGMAYSPGRSSAFARAIERCVMFGLAHHTDDGLAVRRRVPPLTERHLRRLPPAVATEHDRHTRSGPADAGLDGSERARGLARAMIAAGDCVGQIEHQLVAVGVDPVTAAVAAETVSSTEPRSPAPVR